MKKIFFCFLFFLGALEAGVMEQFISSHIPLRKDGKIDIPENIKHIKLDIGLSYNAPMSQYWLSHEDDLIVFGFEPLLSSVDSIKRGAIKLNEAHGDPLDTSYIGKRFFLIPCALGLSEEKTIKFYVTKNDCGCSSIYPPNYWEVEKIVDVPIFCLSDFFDLFPFESHPIVDYIKIDAQGSDLNIIKSGGNYLKERVVYVTLEAENNQYKNTTNSEKEIDTYMESIGFTRHRSNNTSDPTYFNPRFLDYVRNNEINIYQER